MVWPANLPFDPCAGKVTQNVNWQQLYRQRSNLPPNFNCEQVYFLSYVGHLFEFEFTRLRDLGTTPEGELVSSRTLRIHDDVFYWVGFDNVTGTTNELFRSPDGVIVEFCSKPSPSHHLVHFDIASDGRIWAFWNNGNESHIYYSDDQGDNWSLSQTFPEEGQIEFACVTCHPDNPDWIVTNAGNNLSEEYLWASSDRGATWNSVLLTQIRGAVGPIEPVQKIFFLGDEILFLYNGDLNKFSSVRTNIELSEVVETLIIDDATSPGSLTLYFGAVYDPEDTDVVVFVGDDDLSVRYFWRSTDGGLSFEQIAYPIDLDGPNGFFILDHNLYFAVITAINEVSFYKISNVSTSSMDPELLFTLLDENATPEVSDETFAVVNN